MVDLPGFRVRRDKFVWPCSLVLLFLVVAYVPPAQQGVSLCSFSYNILYHFFCTFSRAVGVSIQLLGQTIPNNSLVNYEDVLYRQRYDPHPTNNEQTLVCVTELVNCCNTPNAMFGDWYYPDGRKVGLDGEGTPAFQRNRGQYGSGQMGSVRLWRRWNPPERGLFHCQLPDTNNVVQTLYVNICEFPVTSVLVY